LHLLQPLLVTLFCLALQWYANAHHKTARILKEAEHDSDEDEM
jgi:hypothetical protein